MGISPQRTVIGEVEGRKTSACLLKIWNAKIHSRCIDSGRSMVSAVYPPDLPGTKAKGEEAEDGLPLDGARKELVHQWREGGEARGIRSERWPMRRTKSVKREDNKW